jgi:hypothetical protein
MCQTIPPPPPEVEADLPDPIDGQPETKRQQLEAHATDPVCAACHSLTDPIGLALEHYDALGGWRETDQGLAIDPSGELDGMPFGDAVELGTHLAEHPQVAECMVKNLYRYAVGHIEQPEEDEAIDALVEVFEASGWDLSAVIAELGASEGFRIATAPVDEGEGA